MSKAEEFRKQSKNRAWYSNLEPLQEGYFAAKKTSSSSRYEHDLSFNLPNFDGKGDENAFVDWLGSVEATLSKIETNENVKVKLVASCLRKHALKWWDELKLHRKIKGKDKIRLWSKMEQQLKIRFLSKDYMHQACEELCSLKQGKRSICKYIEDFEFLMHRCDESIPLDFFKLNFYVGLNSSIACKLDMESCLCFAELCLKTIRIEKEVCDAKTMIKEVEEVYESVKEAKACEAALVIDVGIPLGDVSEKFHQNAPINLRESGEQSKEEEKGESLELVLNTTTTKQIPSPCKLFYMLNQCMFQEQSICEYSEFLKALLKGCESVCLLKESRFVFDPGGFEIMLVSCVSTFVVYLEVFRAATRRGYWFFHMRKSNQIRFEVESFSRRGV